MSRIASPFALLIATVLALSPVALSAFSLVPASSATAAEGDVTWSVEPVATADGQRRTFDYSVDPGTQISDSVVITNQGLAAAEFLIYGTDAMNELETGAFGLLKRDEVPTDAGAWITLASEKLTIEPGMQATVPFNLLVPSDATPGDHVAGVVAAVLTQGEQDGAAVTLEQRVGARVYLKVSGVPDVGVEAGGFVTGFTPEINPFAAGTVNVTYDVKNTGNLRMDVNQKLAITGPFNIPLGELTPEPLSNLLPRQTVRITTEVPAIAAIALAWSTVTLVPGEVGTAGKVVEEPTGDAPASAPPVDPAVPVDPAAAVVDESQAVEFVSVSSTAFSLAVSWTLLALVIALILVVYFVWRYVSGTRERLYTAIDDAAAAARDEVRNAPSTTGKGSA